MVCGPGQVSGPSAIPFWSTCYDINSDMGAFLTSRSPNFQAELSDPNYVWRQFGKPPKDEAGRQRLATAGPSLREQLQASLNALHPVLGKDEVAQALFDQGQKMLSTLRALTPDTKALEASMKQKIGDAAARYGPGALQQFYDEETKQKLLGIIGAATAPLAVKYGGLAKALSGTITAGAIGGATVLIAGIWNGWVQERLGEQMNELHATSGTLADRVTEPWQGYAPGDWVAMRELLDQAWVPRIGLVLDHGDKTNRRYARYRVAVLPTSDIVGRGAADLALMDQMGMRKAETMDPKLRFWRAAMAVKNKAELTAGCRFRRRMMKVGAGGPTSGESCAFGPVRRRPGQAIGIHEQAGPPAPGPSVDVVTEVVTEAQWEGQRIEAEDRRLSAWNLEIAAMRQRGEPTAIMQQKFEQEVHAHERAKFEHWQRRSSAEQKSERALAGMGIKRLAQQTLRAHPGSRLVVLTHIDDQGNYWFRSINGNLRQLPAGAMIVDVTTNRIPDAWKQSSPIMAGFEDDTSSDISEMDVHLGTGKLGPRPPDSMAWTYGPAAAAIALLLLGFLLLSL